MTRSARGNARGLWGVMNCNWGEGFRIEKVRVCMLFGSEQEAAWVQ